MTTTPSTSRLTRSRDQRWISGVCGGLALRFGLDPALVRLAVVVLTILGFGSVVLIYLAAWILMPMDDALR